MQMTLAPQVPASKKSRATGTGSNPSLAPSNHNQPLQPPPPPSSSSRSSPSSFSSSPSLLSASSFLLPKAM
ncbi:hypothetical protein SERLA73DRAFT_132193, partial [Serpula lacrymans var. lacrymans S7.3]